MEYLSEFITIALVHLVAVASPGPDFAIIVRYSVNHGRRIAMYASVGVGLGILLHVAYSLVGLSVVIKTTPWLYNTICYVEQQSVEDKFHMFAQQKQEQILHILLRFLVHCVAKLQAERHVVRLEKEGLENKI